MKLVMGLAIDVIIRLRLQLRRDKAAIVRTVFGPAGLAFNAKSNIAAAYNEQAPRGVRILVLLRFAVSARRVRAGRRHKMSRSKVIGMIIVAVVVIGAVTWKAYPHCQIPCGIYGDDARLEAIGEHIVTIEKSMRKIDEIGAAEKPNYNQLVRWVSNKERHADEISEIVTQYFMAQRVKPADASDKKAWDQYVKKLTLLHRMLVAAMKAKQTTDLQHTKALSKLLDQFTRVHKGK